jgi:hypothetical protein
VSALGPARFSAARSIPANPRTTGLEQEFNSLDAQREACEAYVTSQRHAGWVALPGMYDDGGLSGGTMERPALQRLDMPEQNRVGADFAPNFAFSASQKKHAIAGIALRNRMSPFLNCLTVSMTHARASAVVQHFARIGHTSQSRFEARYSRVRPSCTVPVVLSSFPLGQM